MTLDNLIQKVFYALCSICATYGISQIQHLVASVDELNRTMAVVVIQLADQQAINRDHEIRLRQLEKRR